MKNLSMGLLFLRIREQIILIELVLTLIYFLAVLQIWIGMKNKGLVLLCQVHRTTRRQSLRYRTEKYIKLHIELSHSAFPSENASREIQDLFGTWALVIKQRTPQEKGVLYVMFTKSIYLIRDGMDVQRLLQDYILIFEPSWSGYCDLALLYFTQFSDPIFVLSAEKGDYDFLSRLNTNLVPVPLGPCDWVDPVIAEPYIGNQKRFDLVMNSNWGPVKRHHLLFRALAKIPNKLSVALIGGEWGGVTLEKILEIASHYGVKDQLTIFESIPYSEVMNVICSSRLSILLSRKEGSNRALAESIFCDVPVLLLEEHVGGIRKNIVAETGWIVPERTLAKAIQEKLLLCDRMAPRKWGLDNISYIKSGQVLNAFLRDYLEKKGFSWENDIVNHSNSPDLTYVCEEEKKKIYIKESMQLQQYLLS